MARAPEQRDENCDYDKGYAHFIFEDGILGMDEKDDSRMITVIFKNHKTGRGYRWVHGFVGFCGHGRAVGAISAGSKLDDDAAMSHGCIIKEDTVDQVIGDVTSRLLAVVALLIQQGKDADARRAARAARKKRRA